MTNCLNWHLTHNKNNNILTHNMILVLSSDGVRQLGLVSDIIGVSVDVDWLVLISSEGVRVVLRLVSLEVGGWCEGVELVSEETVDLAY